MTTKRMLIALFWVAAICMPAMSSLIVITQLPANVEIPMHWNAQGQVDRFGSPWEMLPISLIMSGCNLLLALSYLFVDKLFALGLVHGISRRASRPFLCGSAIFLLIVWMGVLTFWLSRVGQVAS